MENGWLESKSKAAPIISPYWNYRDEISTYDGIMFKGEKVIVPKSMQHEILAVIHSSHLGVEKCKCRHPVLAWDILRNRERRIEVPSMQHKPK